MPSAFWQAAGLLVLSNVFMTFAWYGHLRYARAGDQGAMPLWKVILLSWGIALLEYVFMVPANRWGSARYSAAELKIMQEVITLLVFVPFAVFFMEQPLRLDFLWAGLCLVGAVYFVFRSA